MRIQNDKWHEIGFWDWVLLVMTLFMLIGGLATKAHAQCPEDYGCALYYRSDIWDHSNLKGYWSMNPGLSGDMTGKTGDFENWAGAMGGCTDCPIGWGCDCTTFGGDINQETTLLYQGNSSAALDTGGAFYSVLYHVFTFEANKAYQVSYRYRSANGTEDAALVAGNMTLTETYNFSTNTWTAPVTSMIFTDVSTSWSTGSAYIATGTTAKASYLLGFVTGTADGTKFYVDDVQVRELRNVGIVGQLGNVLDPSLTSDPVWGDSEIMFPRVGTGPALKRGMKLDGVDDWVFRADDDTFDPSVACANQGKNFTVWCRGVVPNAVDAVEPAIIGKFESTINEESWVITRFRDDLYFYQSNDGTPADRTSLARTDVFFVDAVTNFVVTYTFVGAANSEANIYANNRVVVSSNTLEGPLFDSDAALTIGHVINSASFPAYWADNLGECGFHCGAMTATQANKVINPYYPATKHGDGFFTHTCSQSASPAVCSTNKCRDAAPNTCQSEGTGSQAIFGPRTELCGDNSFEALAGDDSAPNFTNWAELEVAGDGTAAITAYRADIMHGSIAVRMSLTGTTSYARMTSKCLTTGIGSDVTVSEVARKLSGTAAHFIQLREFLSVDCSTGELAAASVIASGDLEEQWQTRVGIFAAGSWNVGTNSFDIRAYNYQSASDILVDAVSIKAASYHTPWFENPGAGSTSSTAEDLRLDNPLARWSDLLQAYMYAGGFCVWAWMHTDWVGDDGVLHYIVLVPATAGSNNQWQIIKGAGDTLLFSLFDSAGDARFIYLAVTDTNWTEGNWKYVEVCSNNTDNVVAGHFYNVSNSTWYTLGGLGGAGTGIQDGQSDELRLGSDSGTNALDGHMSTFGIGPYSAIFPLKGFNKGVPPSNGGRPY